VESIEYEGRGAQVFFNITRGIAGTAPAAYVEGTVVKTHRLGDTASPLGVDKVKSLPFIEFKRRFVCQVTIDDEIINVGLIEAGEFKQLVRGLQYPE